MYRHYRISEVEGQVFDLEDLIGVELKNDNLSKFLHDWEMCLLGMAKQESDETLEMLLSKQLRKSASLERSIALYDHDIAIKHESKDYHRLMAYLRSFLEMRHKQRIRNDLGPRHAHAFKTKAKATSNYPSLRQGLSQVCVGNTLKMTLALEETIVHMTI